MNLGRLRNLPRVALPALLLVACSGTGAPSDVPSFVQAGTSSKWRADEAQTALSYRPDPDGLSFGNYQMTDPGSFSIDDAAALLKGAVCATEVNGCVPSAAAVEWVETVQAALQGGLCEGFSLLSMNNYLAAGATSTPTFALTKSKDVERTLSRLFATQFMPEVRSAARSWRNRSLSEIVSELTRALSSKSDMYTIGLYSQSGGHAVVPYAIDEMAPGMYVVSVYDSNWPGRDRFLEINLNSDIWRFSYKAEDQTSDTEAWSGGSGSIDITPFSARTGEFSAPFDQTDEISTLTLTVRADDTTWSVSRAGEILASALKVPAGEEIRGAFGMRTVVLDVASGPVSVKLPGGPASSTARVSITSASSAVSVQAGASGVEVEFDVGSRLEAQVEGEAAISTVAAESRVTLASSSTARVSVSPTGETAVQIDDAGGGTHRAVLPPSPLRRDGVVDGDDVKISSPGVLTLPARSVSEDLEAHRRLDTKQLGDQTTTSSTTSSVSSTTSTTSLPSPPTSRTPRTTTPGTTRPGTPPTTLKPQPVDCRTIDPSRGADTDGDGLSDELEVCVRTNPQSRDTDADGLTDADEVLACLYPKPGPAKCSNPTRSDSDSDGLRDAEEIRIGTNPNVEDTDQDGIPDGVELSHGLNPLRQDSDNDGVPDSL